MQKNKGILSIVLMISIFIAGIVAGKLSNVWYFEIDDKINLIDILSIITTIFVAYIIKTFLEKEKNEKDLLLKRTENIYDLIEASCEKVVSGQIIYQEAASHMKRISMSLNCIYGILKNIDKKTDETLQKKITENIDKLKELLTNTPVIKDEEINELPPTVKDNILYLTKSQLILIEGEYDKLRNNILLLQLSINKA